MPTTSQSRFINERVHANIQKDGTYSVVPRMWGGVTNAARTARHRRCRRQVRDPDGQGHRRPAHRPAGREARRTCRRCGPISAQAGFVSGHAYAKGLRTVKTCVGSDWCRFGTQDSTGLGIRIEKFMWGSWTPAKVKMAVSGCPRNCAEATCKDVGVICVDCGYEIHFAGAAGLDIKGTEVLGHVKTEDEALEHHRGADADVSRAGPLSRAHLQMGQARRHRRDQAPDLDDGEKRKAYYERFVFSQKFAQVDPWSERVSGKDKHEFRPMADFALRGGGGVSVDDEDWMDRSARSRDIPRRGARCVATPEGKIAVFRTQDDQVFAIDDHCPHKGGPLSQGIVHGTAVTCPLHNWVISLETGKALGADEGAVRTIPVQDRGRASVHRAGSAGQPRGLKHGD